jgi:Eukaryotic translation initiation factor eIF2A
LRLAVSIFDNPAGPEPQTSRATDAMRTIVHRGFHVCSVALALGFSGGLTPAQAQPQVRIEVAPGAGAIVADPSEEILAYEFDRSTLGEIGPNAELNMRNRLEWLLGKKIDSFDRLYGLTAAQKQRLRLAGTGDIRRFNDRVDLERQKFIAARRRRADDAVRATYAEAAVLRDELKVGPFGEGSLFAKAQNTVLSPAQIDLRESRRQRAAKSTLEITLDNARRLEKARRFQKDVHQLGWTGRENEIALLAKGGSVEVCSRDTFQPLRTIGKGHKLAAFDFSRDSCVVAPADNSTKVFLINLSTGREVSLQADLRQPVAAFSPDGKLLATGGAGLRALLWSAETGTRLHELNMGSTDGALTPTFSPDGTIVAIGNRNSNTCLFDVATGRLRHRLQWQSSNELKFDPSGKRLAIAYADGNLAIWDVATGELSQRAVGRAEESLTLDWSPDGTLIASGGRAGAVTVWNATTLKSLIDLDAPESVDCVRFNPEGTRLFVAGRLLKSAGGRSVEVFAVPPE